MSILKTRVRHCAFWWQGKLWGFPQLGSIMEVANCIACVVIAFPGSGFITEPTAQQLQTPADLPWASLVRLQKTQSEASEGGALPGSEAETWS